MKKSVPKINITITPTHTLVGETAIQSDTIDHIFIVLEDGTIYDIDHVLNFANRYAKKLAKKPKVPWKITTKIKRGIHAFNEALEEAQTDMPTDPRPDS